MERCKAVKKDGSSCSGRATGSGFCMAHSKGEKPSQENSKPHSNHLEDLHKLLDLSKDFHKICLHLQRADYQLAEKWVGVFGRWQAFLIEEIARLEKGKR